MCREENPGEPDQRGHAINRGWASVQAKRNYEQETPDARNELRALMLADGRNALFKRVRFEGEFEQATLRHQMKILSWWLRKILDHVIVFNESSLYRHLRAFFRYYHQTRTHLALQKDSRNRVLSILHNQPNHPDP
jgi:hypothetical protein